MFHVLIYYAVRFLHHNITASNVGQFLHDYFDDYASFYGGKRCGNSKRSAMKYGEISLVNYHGSRGVAGTKLHFLRPPQGRASASVAGKHPLDDIVSTLLSWFEAYYEHHFGKEVETNNAAPTAEDELSIPEDVCRTLDDEFLDAKASGESDDEDANAAPPRSRPPYAQTFPKADELLAEKELELALNLETHDAFIELLRHALQNAKVWPTNEKTKDQRRQDFVPDLEPQSDEEEEEVEADEESDDDDSDEDDGEQAEQDTDNEREPEDDAVDYDLLIEFDDEDEARPRGEPDAQKADDHIDDSGSPARPNPAQPIGDIQEAMHVDENAPSSSVRRSKRVLMKRKADEAKTTSSKRSRQD